VIFHMEPKFPYRRVADDLRRRIESGELTEQLPTRAELAEESGLGVFVKPRSS
jgi:DNA-binding GntR family transcriptional regulator